MSRLRALIALISCCSLGSIADADQHGAVLDIERLFAAPNLDGPSPKSVRISPDSSRVTFLRGKDTDPLQMDLWEYRLEHNDMRLLVDSTALLAEPEQLSEEERARRERLRIVGQRGIVDYHFSPDGRLLLFPLGGDLYLYEIASGRTRHLTATEAGETDPKFSSTGRYVSFVREQNLFVIALETGKEQQLTSDGGGVIKNGMAEFIAQEEMDRYTGYWWSPDDSAIAFARVDESPVEVAERFEVYAEDFRVYEQRYPATGTPNVYIQIGVTDPAASKTRWLDLGKETDVYVPRVDWFPNGDYLAVQRQSRDQKTLQLLKVDATSGKSRLLLTESSDTWINLHNELRFLQSENTFIWLSERSGHAHLYLYDNKGELIRPLTSGEWDVGDGQRARSALLHIDENTGIAYVTATLDSPLERNIYAVSIDGSAAPKRVSESAGWHRADFALNGEFFVDSYDSVSTPPQVAVYRVDGSRIAFIEENALGESHPYHEYLDNRPTTEFGELVAADGQVLYYRIKKPADFDPKNRYPVIVSVYGGPQGQRVTNRWSVGFEEVLVHNGFIIFSLDNRGTGFRGVQFDAPIYRHTGHVEVVDQMVGVEYLRSLDYVDPGRIGVFGWSYGGYMALMCMFREPRVFAAGVAGAPVTDWAFYDTHYTERYLGTPQDNPSAYAASSVFPYAGELRGPLLVIHGMADDNVLFTHSTKLFKVLQDAQRDFDMMTYPGSKHALLRVPSTGTHAYSQILGFFRRHLVQTPSPERARNN
jgi:dipeptidyl-peptidase-4